MMVPDHLNCISRDRSVILSSTEIVIKVNAAAARALDGYLEYAVAFHSESQDLCSIRETLEVIFRGKSGLLIDT